jgi:hypothetical protein
LQQPPGDLELRQQRKAIDNVMKKWDYPTMTLTADSRGRLTAAEIFQPGKSFDVVRLPSGQILISELARKEAPIVRSRRVQGRLRGAALVISRETVAAGVRAERDER